MPTESEVVDQLSEYCNWLESELAAPMHRTRVVQTIQRSSSSATGIGEIIALSPGEQVTRRRSRLTLCVAAAVLLVAAAALFARQQHHDNRTTTPAASVDTTTAGSRAPAEDGRTFGDTWAPVNLPAGLVVWDVGWSRSGGTYAVPFTEQLFGRYDISRATVATGLLIRIQESVDDVLPADSNVRVTVRGTQGWVFNPDPSSATISIEWVEQGRQISVQGRGMSLDEAVTALDAMQWRADGAASFEPDSSALPVLAEESSGTDYGQDVTNFSITDSDGPEPSGGPLGSQAGPTATNDVVLVQVGAPIPGVLHPDLIFGGQRRTDGSIVSDGVLVEPGGKIIQVLGAAVDDTVAARDAIISAVQPSSRVGVAAMIDAANTRLQQLPQVAIGDFPGGGVVLRGGTAAWPLAICLTIDEIERCRSVAGLRQFSSWQDSVLINGRWFIVGRQPSTAPSPVVYPWTPALPVQFPRETIFEPTRSQVVRDQLLWFVEIPRGTDVVGVGYVNGDTVTASTPIGAPQASALRRPDQ